MFRAAYLSYSAQFHIDAPSSFAYNVAQHILHVAAEAEQGAGIVVCPEYGISGFSNMPKSDWVSGGWYETWADPGDDAWNVPCTAPDHYPEAPSLVSLSCAAREHSISVVASIPRLQDGQLYNVALAFTESGRLVSYAKQNLWGESAYIDVPEGNHPTTFTTDAGVTFGLVVCADLIYKSPVLDLVKHFVAPVAWDNSMAQMQVLGWAQGWSGWTGATLIVSNHRAPNMSGSGVFKGGEVLSSSSSFYEETDSLHVVDVGGEEGGGAFVVPNVVAIGEEPLPADESWAWKELEEGAVLESATGAVECTVRSLGGAAGGYALGVVDGMDADNVHAPSMTWGAKACGVMACGAADNSCLDYRAGGGLESLELGFKGLAGDGVVVEVVGYVEGQEDGQVLMDWRLEDGVLYVEGEEGVRISSALVYSREFAWDPGAVVTTLAPSAAPTAAATGAPTAAATGAPTAAATGAPTAAPEEATSAPAPVEDDTIGASGAGRGASGGVALAAGLCAILTALNFA